MLRTILLSLLGAAYLTLVGLWPPAAAPIATVAAGLAVIAGLIPSWVWLVAGAIAWRKTEPATVAAPVQPAA